MFEDCIVGGDLFVLRANVGAMVVSRGLTQRHEGAVIPVGLEAPFLEGVRDNCWLFGEIWFVKLSMLGVQL